MLEPAWIEEHHAEFDVFHIHFGFDAISPDTLEGVLCALDKYRKVAHIQMRTRCTTVPGIAAAAAMATAPVPVMAWCSTPIEKIRAKRSIEPASTVRPSDAV
jgi:hypothetical protein